MEEKCSSPGCLKSVEYVCSCTESKCYLCEVHLAWHISTKKKIEHSTKRIEFLNDNDNKDCKVCMRKTARYLCLCRNLGVKLCAECFDLHSLQNPGKHSKEPVEACEFIKEEKDIMLYMERRDQIDAILKVIKENTKDIQAKEEYFRMGYSKLIESIKKWYEERLNKFGAVKKVLKKFEDDIRSCKFKKDITSHWVFNRLKEKDYAKVFKTIKVDLNEDSADLLFKNFCQIESDPILSGYMSSVIAEPNVFITEKDTGSLYQRIQSIYTDHGPSMNPKLYKFYTLALEPSKIEAIQQVELSNCSLGVMGCRHLASLLPALIQIQSLNLSSNSIGPNGAKELAVGLSSSKSLRTLLLAWNKLENKGMEHLTEAISELNNLKILQLSWNDISENGAQFLARALVHCEKLEKLELWNNPLGPEGIRNLMIALPYLTKLKTLDLNKTDLGSEGASTLAMVLPRLPELINLTVAGNNIGAAGVHSISKAFGANKNLQVIDIARNSIKAEGARHLYDNMAKLQKETTIMIGGNLFTKEERNKLRNSASSHGLRLN